MRLVLASQSSRRRELLALIGLPFEVVTAGTDEERQPGETPADYVRRLSREKALAAALSVGSSALILAADTIVVDGTDVLEKPRNAEDAAAMLRRLRGHTHEVYTAVTLLETTNGQMITQVVCSPVPMRSYSEAEIAAYIASGDPFDKAGAYGIQNSEFHPAEGFAHCFANVMGLPLCHVARVLNMLGVKPPVDVPTTCQAHLQYSCPVYRSILASDR